MKKIFIILLLMCSFSGFSQTEKGDFVIGIHPEFSDQEKNNVSINNISGNPIQISGIRIENYRGILSGNYYLSDKFSAGGNLGISYSTQNPLVSNQYFRSFTNYEVGPILRYNLLKTRLTPYLQVDINYNYRKLLIDIPNLPLEFKQSYKSEFSGGIGIGLSYFIRERFAIQANTFFRKYNNQTIFQTGEDHFLSFGFGCLLIINNPRSKIESPR